MKKRKKMGSGTMTFREGCDAYLLNCRQRNLREATLKASLVSMGTTYCDAHCLLRSMRGDMLFFFMNPAKTN